MGGCSNGSTRVSIPYPRLAGTRPIEAPDLITGRRIAGSSFGGVKGRDQVLDLIDRSMAGEIDVAPFISHRLSLDEVNRGFDLMEAQDGIRSVIRFG